MSWFVGNVAPGREFLTGLFADELLVKRLTVGGKKAVTRRKQQDRRELKRQAKSAQEKLDSADGSYVPPDRKDCKTRQWHVSWDDSNTVRVQFNIWRQGKNIVDFTIVVQRLGMSGWDDVERFDCCHGHCHLHAEGRTSSTSLYQLDTVEDVHIAFVRASSEAGDRARIIRDKGVGG